MTRHFIDLENAHGIPLGTKGHGFNGFLDITINSPEFLKNQSEAQVVLQAAATLMGQNGTGSKIFDLVTRDLNNNDTDHDQQTGIFAFPAHRDPIGRRVSAANPVLSTLNATNVDGSKKYPLTISYHSLATKIVFNTTGLAKPRAVGLQYLVGQSMYSADPRYNASNPGIPKVAFARKEVIISGGAFNSPQLLKLSGIGPKAELAKFNISVLVDLLGVGSNLQDNPEIGNLGLASRNFSYIGPGPCTYGAPGDPCLAAWYEGQGPYVQGPLNALMYKTSNATERDIHIFSIPGYRFEGYYPAETVNVVPQAPPNMWDFSIVKIHPQSRLGTVNLVSANPRDTPDINFHFFEAPGSDADIAAMAEALNFGRKVFDAVASPVGPFTEAAPCKDGTRTCDLTNHIRAQAWSHHATSSCAIGADNDTMAVLDSKFRVRGTAGLRVIDASAFPRVPGSFPVIPTFMLSMKATEDILLGA
jgi:choline dehydrogenase